MWHVYCVKWNERSLSALTCKVILERQLKAGSTLSCWIIINQSQISRGKTFWKTTPPTGMYPLVIKSLGQCVCHQLNVFKMQDIEWNVCQPQPGHWTALCKDGHGQVRGLPKQRCQQDNKSVWSKLLVSIFIWYKGGGRLHSAEVCKIYKVEINVFWEGTKSPLYWLLSLHQTVLSSFLWYFLHFHSSEFDLV